MKLLIQEREPELGSVVAILSIEVHHSHAMGRHSKCFLLFLLLRAARVFGNIRL